MALSKTTGGIAAALGIATGIGTIAAALGQPETAACIQRVASVFGEHGTAIATTIVGAVTTVASTVAYFSHPPTHPGGNS